jgi:hypothetical protein
LSGLWQRARETKARCLPHGIPDQMLIREVEVMIDDPQAYTKAWSFPMQFEFLADTEMIEDVCDNQRDAFHSIGK